jgi:glutamine amidotransferase-like uncharacterized protein
MVAHICNPNNLGSGGRRITSWNLDLAKGSETVSKTEYKQKGLECLSAWGPEFNPQYCRKQKENEKQVL